MNAGVLQSILVAGPTAVGKSEIAIELALLLGGEIVSVDSMQVYRGLDIGTAKPPPDQRLRVPHHLLDVVDITEPFDAARFVTLASTAIADIRARGRLPVLCGGTGLYFKALVHGLGTAPPSDPALRAELEAMPLPKLLAELGRRDPDTLARIDPNNPRRVVRALEVVLLTGRPFGEQRAQWSASHPPSPVSPEATHFGITRRPDNLRARIQARTQTMFASGLVEETRRLLDRGLAQNRTATQAIGYRQVIEHIRGQRSLEDTIALVAQRTWQFARRQMTWFRHQFPLNWVMVEPGEHPRAVAERILPMYHAGQWSAPAAMQSARGHDPGVSRHRRRSRD